MKQLSAKELMLFLSNPKDKEKSFKLVGQRGYDLLDEDQFIVYKDDILIQIFDEVIEETGHLSIDLSAYLDHPVIGVHLKVLWEHFIEYGIPFYYKNEMIGFLLIGRRFNKNGLDPVEEDFLEFISHFWGLYLSNAQQCEQCYSKLTQ